MLKYPLQQRTQSFQLHHTGIKTHCRDLFLPVLGQFQLHHTGIKTAVKAYLKPRSMINFNCTIQELKRSRCREARREDGEFQLHHTGIKTRRAAANV